MMRGLSERLPDADRSRLLGRPRKPRCICGEPFWSIVPPVCPAHPDLEVTEVTC